MLRRLPVLALLGVGTISAAEPSRAVPGSSEAIVLKGVLSDEVVFTPPDLVVFPSAFPRELGPSRVIGYCATASEADAIVAALKPSWATVHRVHVDEAHAASMCPRVLTAAELDRRTQYHELTLVPTADGVTLRISATRPGAGDPFVANLRIEAVRDGSVVATRAFRGEHSTDFADLAGTFGPARTERWQFIDTLRIAGHTFVIVQFTVIAGDARSTDCHLVTSVGDKLADALVLDRNLEGAAACTVARDRIRAVGSPAAPWQRLVVAATAQTPAATYVWSDTEAAYESARSP